MPGTLVRYILIGALAARLQGFPRLSADADITPDRARDNLVKLAAALRELGARVYTESVPEGLPFDSSAEMLARAELWNLVTSAGRLDVAFRPSGTEGYEDLARGAVRFEVFGVQLLAASLTDIIRSKVAADRPQESCSHTPMARDPGSRCARGFPRLFARPVAPYPSDGWGGGGWSGGASAAAPPRQCILELQ